MTKEPDFTMKMMTTYGTLTPYPNSRIETQSVKDKTTGKFTKTEFLYAEVYANHYLYRHTVDYSNNLRYQEPLIEGTWVTNWCAARVFSFLSALVEVNTFLKLRYFVWTDKGSLTLLQFRKKLVIALIDND